MGDQTPLFSVAIPTKGRTKELTALLESISRSSVIPAQVIIVDQNADARLDGVVARFTELPIDHRRVNVKGLSEAKNYAARIASSDILFMPDDDCTVMPDTFQTALDELSRTGADVVFGKCVDDLGADSITRYRRLEGRLTRKQVEGMFVEPATAVRAAVLREIPFNETLGVGAFHGAEEGYDWVLRLLRADKQLFYQPRFILYHPQPVIKHGKPEAIRRVFFYRAGFGRVCRIHGLWGKFAARVLLVIGAIVLYSFSDRAKSRYYLAELSGLLAGISVEP